MLPKRILALTLFAALAAMPTCVLRAQWAVTNGPDGDRAYAKSLAFINGNLFCGTPCEGIYRSSDNGISWLSVSKGLPYCINVNCFASIGSYIFAGTGSGIFSSTDSGENWKESDYGLTEKGVTALMLVGTSLFAGTSEGVFRSVDTGNIWSPINNGLINRDISCLFSDGANLFAGTSLARSNGIFISTNGGEMWEPFGDGFPDSLSILCLIGRGKTILAGTWGGGIYRSDNGGSWRQANKGISSDQKIFLSIAQSGNRLFAGSYEGDVFVSTNYGSTWKDESSGLAKNNINSLVPNETILFAALGYHGVFGAGINALLHDKRPKMIPKKVDSTKPKKIPLTLFGHLKCKVWVESNGEIWAGGRLMDKGRKITVALADNGEVIVEAIEEPDRYLDLSANAVWAFGRADYVGSNTMEWLREDFRLSIVDNVIEKDNLKLGRIFGFDATNVLEAVNYQLEKKGIKLK